MQVTQKSYDFLVSGGGVIGVSIARELKRRHGGRVAILEKEHASGVHASGRNSGVLHAGVYYKAGTLKARLCVEGNRRMKENCRVNGIPMNEYGKVIVPRSESQLPTLRELYQRGQLNGARVTLVDSLALKEIEPCAKTVNQALYVKDTAVVNPQRVMESLSSDAEKEGVEFRFDCAWLGSIGTSAARTTKGSIPYGHLVNCAGLFADGVARNHLHVPKVYASAL